MKNKKQIFIFLACITLFILVLIFFNKLDRSTDIKSDAIDMEMQENKDEIEYKGKKYIRNTYTKAILFMGVDNSLPMSALQDAGYGGQADTIILLAWDKPRNSIKLLSIPRDTMTEVKMTDINGNIIGKNVQHITMAYSFGDGAGLSSEYTRDAVSELLNNLDIDKYITVKTKVISIINSLVGGVEVKIPYEGLDKINASWKKDSLVRLDGEEAEKFLRFRDTGENFSAVKRMEASEEYILGFQNSFKATLSKDSSLIDKIFSQTEDYILTDMTKAEEIDLIKDLASSNDLKKDNIYILPGESNTSEWYDEYTYDKDKTLELVLDMFYREK